jgi:hypothetical protein
VVVVDPGGEVVVVVDPGGWVVVVVDPGGEVVVVVDPGGWVVVVVDPGGWVVVVVVTCCWHKEASMVLLISVTAPICEKARPGLKVAAFPMVMAPIARIFPFN